MSPENTATNKSEQRLIFVVEDDAEIACLIALTLGKSGFATRVFPDGRSTLKALTSQPPALILLDRMLPDIEGLQILRFLKSEASLRYTKTIVVSARAAEIDKVQALDLGVDDYIVKPFSLRELVARVRAVLRSQHPASNHRVLQLGALIADLDARRVFLDSKEVTCSTREFDLLVYFMHNAGHALTRRQLLQSLWSDRWETLDARIVDVYIRRLREKIEDDAANPTRLLTRRGGGYVLVAQG